MTIVSCFTNSYGRFGAAAAIEHLRSAGIDWIELPVRTAGAPSFFGDEPLLTDASRPHDVERVRQRIAASGLRLSSVNVTTGNPLEPRVVEITARKLDIAGDLGATLAVGGAGEAKAPEDGETLFGHLTQIGDHAARHAITYCFETHPGLCRTPAGMLDTMRRLDHPNLRLNFDTGNILYYNETRPVAAGCQPAAQTSSIAESDPSDRRAARGYVEEALTAVREFVRHVHLKDTNGRAGEWHFPALGTGGAVDFGRLLQILREVGFQGPFSLEIEGIAGEPEPSLAEYQRRVAESAAHLRACGYFP